MLLIKIILIIVQATIVHIYVKKCHTSFNAYKVQYCFVIKLVSWLIYSTYVSKGDCEKIKPLIKSIKAGFLYGRKRNLYKRLFKNPLKNNLVTATCLSGRRYSGSFKRRNWNGHIPQRRRWTCLQKLQTRGNLLVSLLIKTLSWPSDFAICFYCKLFILAYCFREESQKISSFG